MENAIQLIMEKIDCTYIPIEEEKALWNIYNLFVDKKYFEPTTNMEMFYMGRYYQNIEINYDRAEKYYRMAIEKNNIDAINSLAVFYEQKRANYDLAEKYYLIAVEKNNSRAMNNLANLYKKKENYDLAEKYYLMAVEKGNIRAMNNLAIFYENIKENQDLAEKYYLMAIENDYRYAMYNLAIFYEDIKENQDSAEKYYLMAIGKGDTDAIQALVNLYDKINAEFKKMILCIRYSQHFSREIIITNIVHVWNNLGEETINDFINAMIEFDFLEEDNIPRNLLLFVNMIKNQLSLMDLHFQYSLKGNGYEQAKQDFLSVIINSQ